MPDVEDGAVIRLTPENMKTVSSDLPIFARSALRALMALKYGELTVRLPGGKAVRISGQEEGPVGDIRLKNYKPAQAYIRAGDIGIAESFIDGDWETPNLTAFIHLFFLNQPSIRESEKRFRVAKLFKWLQHALRRNTRKQARRNIRAHYDLGNEFYGLWLDPSMTYSSALFEPDIVDLEVAQASKYSALAKTTEINENHSVLEIGCGWGGFAEFAAKEIGCSITGLTISKAQLDYARKRIFDAGLAEKVELKLQDYRDEAGSYDRIASIEMVEAVGEAYWPSYYKQLHDRLKPGGQAGVQAITIRDEDFDHYRKWPDFVQAYIFPGGMLLSPQTMRDQGAKVGLSVRNERQFGLSYARTLSDWKMQFEAAWPQIVPLGFDERFKRLWTYYFCYCEAGFLSGRINVQQIVYARD